jgi:hypothetical protein
MLDNSTSQVAADAIVRDLLSRRGLRQEWEEIDEEIQQEIKQAWAALIQKAIDMAGSSHG